MSDYIPDSFSQEDFLLSDQSFDFDVEYSLKAYLSKVYIKGHEYLHDPKFKTRNWSVIVYPDSAPDNWKELFIDMFHVPFAVSPLHDSDLNPSGELKKPHWHVVIIFDGPKSWSNVVKILRFLNGTIPVDVWSLNGLVRYFAHLDNPEKFQYDANLICGYCGFNVDDFFLPSSAEQDRYVAEMIKFISANMITDILEFSMYCIDEHYNDWYRVLSRGTGKSLILSCLSSNEKLQKRLDSRNT